LPPLYFGSPIAGPRPDYIADLQSNGTRIGLPKRLTFNEGWDSPAAWTADSKAVVFSSNRNGHYGIFKQPLDGGIAEAIVTLPQNVFGPRLSPDGKWVIYLATAEDAVPSARDEIMKVPITGGAPQLVMKAHVYDLVQDVSVAGRGIVCSQRPPGLCAFAEQSGDHKQLIFTTFDLAKGRGDELARFATEPTGWYPWALSPDGTCIAVLTRSLGQIDLLYLDGRPRRQITVKGWSNLDSVNWTADGEGLLTSARMQKGTALLDVDLRGQAHLLWNPEGGRGTYAVPSPDGRHLKPLCFAPPASAAR
jgi:Tol biopolymer transport system component